MTNEITVSGNASPASVSAPGNVANLGNQPDALAGLPADLNRAFDGADRRVATSFAKAMSGVPPEVIQKALRWYLEHDAEKSEAQDAQDRQDKQEGITAMRREWGQMYVHNMRALRAFFNTLPYGVQQALETAELEDGTLLLNSPVGIGWLFDLARRPTTENAGLSFTEELDKLVKMSGDQRGPYWRGTMAAIHQARHIYLIELQQGRGK